jgi:hypothetical protein
MVSKNVPAAIRLGLAALLPFCLSISTFGSGTSTTRPAAVSTERDKTAHAFVEDSLRTWQGRLNLNDWKITVELVPSTALEPKTLGNIHWDMNVKQAAIHVLSASEYKLPMKDMLDDMEFTIVHELVHLHLASLPHTSASRRPEERAVNELARALLRLAEPEKQ